MIDYGILARNKDRSAFLRDLNAARNELLYTHGAGFSFLNTVGDKTMMAIEVIKKLEGNTRWLQTCDDLFAPPMLDEKAIFDAMDAVESYFEKIVIP